VPSTGNYPLRAAILSGEGEACRLLLARGANVNQCSARGTPLMAAAGVGDCETLALLLDSGAAVDAEARDGQTALMAAVRENQKEAARLLLRRGANPETKNADGKVGAAVASKLGTDAQPACSRHLTVRPVHSCTAQSAVDLAQVAVLPEVYSLLMQFSIVAAADDALRASERRQAAAAEEVESAAQAAAGVAREELEQQRVEVRERVTSLRAESVEILNRLGIKRP
jgi:hypothetical protein